MKNIVSSRARVDRLMDELVSDLCELVRIPSVSAPAFDQEPLERTAQMLVDWLREAGLSDARTVRHTTAEGVVSRPAVLASRPAAPGAPTVALYAHHDVQPPGDPDLWTTPAFDPQVRGGRLYGRGTADDGAGLAVHLGTVRALAERPGVGIRVFFEGEEEIGSPTFASFLEEFHEDLRADIFIVADSANWKVGIPSLTTSLRGVVTAEVVVSTLREGVHSGVFGGPVLDAVTAACRLISTLHDERGNPAVEGLLEGPEASVDYPEEDFRAEAGVLEGVELAGSGAIATRLWSRSSLSVIGFDATSVERASNTLIPSCRFALSLRVAPGQSPQQAAAALENHLRINAPLGAQLEIKITEMGPSYAADTDTPTVELAQRALADAWGCEPKNIGLGASIPFISTLKESFPEAEILVTGVEDPLSKAHGIDESTDLEELRRALLAQVLLLERLAPAQ